MAAQEVVRRKVENQHRPADVIARLIENQEQILNLVATFCEVDPRSFLLPSPQEFSDTSAKQRAEFFLRVHQQKQKEKSEKFQKGLERVTKHYAPKHSEVYMDHWLFSKHLTLPMEAWTQQDLGLLEKVGVTEPVRGTFSFPFVSEQFASKLYEELMHYEETSRNTNGLIPLYRRHDNNFGSLEHCGFQPFMTNVESVWRKFLANLLPGYENAVVTHAFLVRNTVEGDETVASFKIHRDTSDLTFNLCLHASEGFEGSTVGFYTPAANAEESDAPPTEVERVYTHVHKLGHAVVHDGTQWHKTDGIKKGVRASLIIWARRQ
jgi:hypothetical protein